MRRRTGSCQTDSQSCATKRIVNTQLPIAGLWSFIGVHCCYDLLQRYHEEIKSSVAWFSRIKLHKPTIASDRLSAHVHKTQPIQVEVTLYLGQTDPGRWDVELALWLTPFIDSDMCMIG